jgi:hypothetical protein
MQDAMRATTPPYQLAARTAGEPALGSGAIYPMAEREILVPTAAIPSSWPKVYAMDVGWNKTAVVWGAKNPGNGQIVLYDEHYIGCRLDVGLENRGDTDAHRHAGSPQAVQAGG